MAAERFSLLLESTTRGTAEVEKLEQALAKVMATAENVGKKTETSMRKSSDSVRQQADTLKNAIQNPLQAAGDAAESFALRYGKIGVVAVGTTAALVGAGAAIFGLANATQNLAEEQTNASLILGMNIKDYGLFSQAAKNAGVDSGLLTASMRGLSKALSDNSEEGKQAKRALTEIGVGATDLFGQVKPTRELLLGIADALGQIENPAQRADAAVKILGRSGLGLIPLLNKDLRSTIAELDRLGVGFDQAGAAKANRFGNAVDELSTKLDVLKRKAGEASIAILEVLFPDATKTRKEKAKQIDDAAALGEIFREAGKASRAGQTLSLSNADMREMAFSGGILRPAPSADQAFSLTTQNAGAIIARMRDEKDSQSRLAAARKDLAEAERSSDITAYTAAQSRIAGLEAAIAAETKAKQLAEKLATFALPDRLGPNINRSTRVPSLLSGRERILRGDSIGGAFAVDPEAYNKANAGAQQNTISADIAFLGRSFSNQQTSQQRQLATAQQALDLETRRIQLLAGPGGEVEAINQIAMLRLSSLTEQLDLGREFADVELERVRIVKERELEILGLKKQQREDGRNAAESLFDASVAGGGGLRSFITSQALAIPRKIAGNLGAEFGGLTGRFSLGLGGLGGRLLQGTPFGADPLKSATDMNTQATVQNTQALMALSGFGGGTAGIGGAIMSGATNIPGIFRFGGGAPNISSTSGLAGYDPAVWGGNSIIPGITPKGTSGFSKGIGAAGIIASAGFGAYSGFSAGGAQGLMTGTSSLLGGVAGLLPLIGASGPLAPILGAGALALGLGAALLGDPKKKRAEGLSAEAERRRFDEPMGATYTSDIYGRQLDYDYSGRMRPIVVNNYNTNLYANDAASFEDQLERSAVKVASVVTDTVIGGNAEDLVGTLRQAM